MSVHVAQYIFMSSSECSRWWKLLVVSFVVVLCYRSVAGSFSIEFVDFKLLETDYDGAVFLYECDTPSPDSSPQDKSISPSTSQNHGLVLFRPNSRRRGGVACRRVESPERRQAILAMATFFLVHNPKLDLGERLFDADTRLPLQLPTLVNVGVELDKVTAEAKVPKWKTANLQDTKELLAKLKSIQLLPHMCPDYLVNFFSVADIKTFTLNSQDVVMDLAGYVAVLDRIVKLYYEDYYRTFLMYVFKYEVDMRLKRRTRIKLVSALNIVLPKMMDPCFIMAHQTTAKALVDANKSCSSYCKVLVVAADIYKEESKTCKTRWTEGKCEKKRCICLKPTRGLSVLTTRAPMHRCNNQVVQANIQGIFRSVGTKWWWTKGLMRWIFELPDFINKDLCSRMPDGTRLLRPADSTLKEEHPNSSKIESTGT
nr:PREDICTED: uncharacterized protein LOC109038357 [Bemisia tabaci]